MCVENKKIAIIPCFGSKVHDILFEKISEGYGFNNSCYLDIQRGLFKKKSTYLSMLRAILLLVVNFSKMVQRDIRDINYKGVQIGLNVNEEVIAFSKTATCNDIVLIIKKILKAVLIVDFYQPLFASNRIGVVLCGDEAYVFSGVCAQMACLYGVSCYCIKGGYEVYATKYDCSWKTGFRRDDFDSVRLSDIDHELLIRSESILEKLCNNNKSDLYYMPTTNKEWSKVSYDDLDIIIFAHDFFDAPGIRGGNIYSNHVEWVENTLDFLLEKNTKIGVRFHPNSREKNDPIINRLRRKYDSRVVWVDGELSLKALKEKIKGVVTVYGTICLESAYLGIPVVAAGMTQWSLVNLVQESNNETDYKKNLSSLLDGDMELGESEKSERRNNSIKTFALGFLAREFKEKVIHYPFDDIDIDLWSSIFHEPYPNNIYQRREVFLKSDLSAKAALDIINKEKNIVKIFD